tara:strand:+ start:1370 stop:3235 length:1866 start_codon:yes stop_codon:yes gene_type:complete
MLKTVSILTPTYDKRITFLEFVAEGISKQTYSDILEWVIVDGTKTGVSILPQTIEKLKKIKNIPKIVYVPQDINRPNTIGNLRNICKKIANGDVMIHFDDDDYYPECRIKYTMSQLNSTKRQIAGTSDLYMYDVHFKTLYQFRSFGDNHILGGTMAYTKKYARGHHFDETVTHAEEGSFTSKFTEPAAVLKADKIMIASSHGINTYSKKKIIWDNLYAVGKKTQTMFYRSKTPRSVMKNKKYVKEYLRVLENSAKSLEEDFDITYFLGMETVLAGNVYYDLIHQQAIYLKSLGYRIEIYSNNVKYKQNYSSDYDGISYKYYTQFNINKRYKNLIIGGIIASWPFYKNNIRLKADKIIIYNPDYREGIILLQEYLDEIEEIVFDNASLKNIVKDNMGMKKYQVDEWEQKVKCLTNFVPQSENISGHSKIDNSIYLCIYHETCIEELLVYIKVIFPKLREVIKNLTIHIYNFHILEKVIKKNSIKDFTVADIEKHISSKEFYTIHRPSSYNEIIQEKYKYKYHFYSYGKYEAGHLTISDIRHSIYIGCMPIIYKNLGNIFNEFKCVFNTLNYPIPNIDMLRFLMTVFNMPNSKYDEINNSNKEVFKTRYTKELWGKEFVKLLK